jgi:hypothetical protein
MDKQIIIIIQFNSIYLRANLTAQRPITKRTGIREEKTHTYKENTKQGNNNNNNNNNKFH